MQLNQEQEKSLQNMLAGRNCFITGSAGTGKSTLIQAFKDKCTWPYVVLAPTGIAAVNVNGLTIHSFFLFAPSLLTIESLLLLKMYPTKRRMILSVRTIVIDEISMVRADVFCAIDWRLRDLARGPNRHKPFGGKQLIVSGDFLQLSPVVTDPIEQEFMEKNCGGIYAFLTKLWKDAGFDICWLLTPHRQIKDTTFIEVLNKVRDGDLDSKDVNGMSAAEVLNSKCLTRTIAPKYEPIKLCTTNLETLRINAAARARLKTKSFKFNAEILGKFLESEYPTEKCMELMEGVRVMVLCNKRLSDKRFICANGDLGVVTSIVDGTCPRVVVLLDKSGEEVVLEPYLWQKYVYKLARDMNSGRDILTQEVIGSFMQIPIRLAYAITIHKSQGLTMDNVDLKLGNGCFSHGQLYTALSRCRSLDGLLLERPVLNEDLILDEKVIEFYKSIKQPPQNANQKTTIEIPEKFRNEVVELISKLNGNALIMQA